MLKEPINYRDFGNENLDWISSKDIEEVDDKNRISNVLKLVHYNKEHPENYNIRLTEELKDSGLIEIREKGQWVQKNSNETMALIIKNIIRIIKRKYIIKNLEVEYRDFVIDYFKQIKNTNLKS
jgi:hypothetical protein